MWRPMTTAPTKSLTDRQVTILDAIAYLLRESSRERNREIKAHYKERIKELVSKYKSLNERT